MILSSETISKRNNLPVELQCRLRSTALREIEWCVQYAGNGHYFDTFEETAEYIRKRKFLSLTKFKTIDSVKSRLLKEAECKLAVLDRMDEIRNTAEYRNAKRIAEVKNQLLKDSVVENEFEASRLLELYYLDEISKNIFQLVMDGQDG